MQTTTLGRGGPTVSRAGLGLMGMSGIYGQADDAESIATIHAALDAGITLLDTGDFYGMGHNELLLRDALRRGVRRESVFIQVKFGGQRDPSGAFVGHDASPAMANAVATRIIPMPRPAGCTSCGTSCCSTGAAAGAALAAALDVALRARLRGLRGASAGGTQPRFKRRWMVERATLKRLARAVTLSGVGIGVGMLIVSAIERCPPS